MHIIRMHFSSVKFNSRNTVVYKRINQSKVGLLSQVIYIHTIKSDLTTNSVDRSLKPHGHPCFSTQSLEFGATVKILYTNMIWPTWYKTILVAKLANYIQDSGRWTDLPCLLSYIYSSVTSEIFCAFRPGHSYSDGSAVPLGIAFLNLLICWLNVYWSLFMITSVFFTRHFTTIVSKSSCNTCWSSGAIISNHNTGRHVL